jgi:tripartite ATP-independent transporter DctM subunit
MSMGAITIVMFVGMLAMLTTGVPIFVVLASVAIVTALFLWGPGAPEMLYFSISTMLNMYALTALPLFVLMGLILQKSGIADEMYETIYRWMGGVKGGLGMGTIGICTVMAAMVGDSAAATVTMGTIAMPSMLKRKYNPVMVTGLIQAGSALGFLIPPSAAMIIYSIVAKVSLGQLFAAGVIPGLILAFLYVIYIGVRCRIQPHMGPALAKHERYSFKEKLVSLKNIILPLFVVFSVLGLVFSGVATPTESAATGVAGALIAAGIKRKFNWTLIKEACMGAMKISALLGWLIVGALVYAKVYNGLGATELVKDMFANLSIGRYGVILIMMLIWFFMGMFLDDAAMLFITAPVFVPVMSALGFDLIWFGILYVVSVQMALLSPPFGYNLFLMRAVAPKEITMSQIYRSVWPFIGIMCLMAGLLIAFPELATWLPSVLVAK